MKFSFSTTVERIEGWMNYHVLPVPDPISGKFREAKTTRILVSVANLTEIRRALQGPHDGGRFLFFSKALMKEAGARFGDVLDVTVETDPDPNFVDVPMEFEIALEQDAEAKARWETFTPGKQRSLCHHVSSAKREETKIKRAVELTEKIRTYTLYGDKGRPKKK